MNGNWKSLVLMTGSSDEYEQTVNNVFECREKVFVYRELEVDSVMGRNDLCFCGSGKKAKYCHSDVNENGVIAAVLKAYRKIDERIAKNQINSMCEKGCNDCCSSYFKISVTEFFAILRALGIGSELAIHYSREAKRRIANLVFPDNDLDDPLDFPECIFVGEADGACEIYQVRPSLCRMYGSVAGITKCPKIASNPSVAQSLTVPDKELMIDAYDCIDGYITASKRVNFDEKLHRPIILWFSQLNEDGFLPSNKLRDCFEAALGLPASEFLRIIRLQPMS